MKLSSIILSTTLLTTPALAAFAVVVEQLERPDPQTTFVYAPMTYIIDCPNGVSRDQFQNKKACKNLTNKAIGDGEELRTYSNGWKTTANGSGRRIFRPDGKYVHCMKWQNTLLYEIAGWLSTSVKATYLCTDTNFRA